MTPGPADEARRALREARDRQRRGEGSTAGPASEHPSATEEPKAEKSTGERPPREETASPGPEPQKTAGEGADVTAATGGEAMREAMQGSRAVDSPHAPGPAHPRPAAASEHSPRTDRPAHAPQDDDLAHSPLVDDAVHTPQGDDPAHAPQAEGPAEEPVHSPPDGDPVPPPARPAQAVREALRAAREQARRDAEAGEGAGRRPTWGPRRAERVPDGARGGASRKAPGVQARDLRDLLAGAFRMPSEGGAPEDADDRADRPRQGSSATGTSGQDTPSARRERTGAATAAETDRTAAAHPAPTGPGPGPVPVPVPEAFPGVPSIGSAASAVPRSMGAPSRDGELRRTFPALPPPTSTTSRSPSAADSPAPFAGTWWGNAWVTALEEGALDPKRLARGRSYAEQGHVDAITVTPGLVLAYVQGSRPRPYRVQVRLRTLDDADWTRFLDAAAERPGHIAALLDKELPQSLADCGVPLLPGPRDLDPHCSCPDRGHPCKHAAALCYQTARLLDADPFVLLLLRGRGERELLDALSRLSAARAARAAQEQEPAQLPGVRATEVALTGRRLPPLPAPLPVPPHPEQPPPYPAAPGGPDPFALDQLATDAAARAHALLTTGRDPVAELTLWQDAVRLAAARPGSGLTATTRALYASLASAADRTPSDLARAVAAWRQGGLEGLAVLEEPWDPPAGRFDRARPLLLAADLPAFRPWRNHLTHPRGHIQLRLGRDGLWYAYESEPGHDDWWPRGTPDLDPVGALTGLGTPNDL